MFCNWWANHNQQLVLRQNWQPGALATLLPQRGDAVSLQLAAALPASGCGN